MKGLRHLMFVVVTLSVALLLLNGPVAADGVVSHFTGYLENEGAWDTSEMVITALPGGRELWTGIVHRDWHQVTTDPRATGTATMAVECVIEASGTINCSGSFLDFVVDTIPGGSWEGEWKNTITPSGNVTVVGEYQGTGEFAGLRMLLKAGSIRESPLSGHIVEHPIP